MRRSLLTLSLLLAMAGNAWAQKDSVASRWPEIASRVRIWTPTRSVTGDLVSIRGDTLVIRTGRELSPLVRAPVGKVELIPGSTVTRIEVSRGREFLQPERVVVGAVVGAAVGLAAAATTEVMIKALFGWDAKAAVDYGESAAVGAVAGAVLGAATPGDRWEKAQQPPAPSTFASARSQKRLHLTPTFR